MLALATAGCLWGTGFYFGKIALTEMPVASMVLFRFAFASAGLMPVIYFDRPHFDGSEWGWVLAASVLGVPVQYLVQFKGLSLTTVSHASLMVGTLPVLLAIAAVMFAGKRLHVGGWIALASSTFGAALMALSGKRGSGAEHASMRGDLLVVLSMFAAIGWILISNVSCDGIGNHSDGFRLLDGHCLAGGCGLRHIGRSVTTSFGPCMDCRRGTGIVGYR